MKRTFPAIWQSPLLLLLLIGVAAAGQSTGSKPAGAQKGAKPGDAEFTCPDPLAAEACKSFADLYKAGDEDVRPWSNASTYVCFRQSSDEFFIVELTNPSFRPAHFDPQTRQLVPDDDATTRGRGHIIAFVHGIEDTSVVPNLFFAGTWIVPWQPTFSATEINRQEIRDSERYGVEADPQQFNVAWRYKNRADKDIDYSLVIQRSTGRFSESFTEEPSKFPFLERNGRCSRLPPTEPKARRGRK